MIQKLYFLFFLCCLFADGLVIKRDIMTNKIEKVTEPLQVGTRIHWDRDEQCLYFVDVPEATIYKYVPSTKNLSKAKIGDVAGKEALAFAFPVKSQQHKFIAGLGRKFITFKWTGDNSTITSYDTIIEVENDLPENRLNGAKVDPYGVLWAGTMGSSDKDGNVIPGKGSLYSLAKGKLKKHESNIGISNGLAWDTKTNKMYYIDTLFPGVYEYDYNKDTRETSNKRVAFSFKENNITGLPDGMVIDTNSHLWIAVIHGSLIIQVDPSSGKLLQSIQLPTPQITALTFAGKTLDTLYVTTAQIEVNGQKPPYPAGSTYSITNIGAKGFSDNEYEE